MIRIGLIGAGYLGTRHLKHLLKLDGVIVSGVLDVDPDVRSRIAVDHGINTSANLEELISTSDGIDVVTPTSTHYDIGMQVILAGKPLFIEKPICANSNQGKRLVETATEKGVPVQVGHIERFNRAFRALQTIEIKPRFIEVHRLSPWNPRGIDVAVVYDLMIHDLDMILNLADSEPEKIYANGVSVVSDSVDIATARIEFSDGLVANVTASRISLKKMRKLRLFGENEYIALDMDKGECEYVGVTDRLEKIPATAQPLGEMKVQNRSRILFRRLLDAPENDALRLELESFRDTILYGTPPPVTGSDGLKSLNLAEQVIMRIQDQ